MLDRQGFFLKVDRTSNFVVLVEPISIHNDGGLRTLSSIHFVTLKTPITN